MYRLNERCGELMQRRLSVNAWRQQRRRQATTPTTSTAAAAAAAAMTTLQVTSSNFTFNPSAIHYHAAAVRSILLHGVSIAELWKKRPWLCLRFSHPAALSRRCKLGSRDLHCLSLKDFRFRIRKAFLEIRQKSSRPRTQNEWFWGKSGDF